jgi:hypothetical protein
LSTPTQTNNPVNLTNQFSVAATTDSVVIYHATFEMQPEQALSLAAWLIRMAQPLTEVPFAQVQAGVTNTN